MRLLAAAAVLLFLPGCLGDPPGFFESSELDCSADQRIVQAASADVLMAEGVPTEVRDQFGEARVTVHARAGQTLTAIATWSQMTGDVDVAFDGPRGSETRVERTWASSNGEVTSTGDYTLELVGDPMATQVTYALYLVANGCTPMDL